MRLSLPRLDSSTNPAALNAFAASRPEMIGRRAGLMRGDYTTQISTSWASSGISRPRECAASIHVSMASRALLSAPSRVSPWLMQPGRLGTSHTQPPSSRSGYMTTCLIPHSLAPKPRETNPRSCPVLSGGPTRAAPEELQGGLRQESRLVVTIQIVHRLNQLARVGFSQRKRIVRPQRDALGAE